MSEEKTINGSEVRVGDRVRRYNANINLSVEGIVHRVTNSSQYSDGMLVTDKGGILGSLSDIYVLVERRVVPEPKDIGAVVEAKLHSRNIFTADKRYLFGRVTNKPDTFSWADEAGFRHYWADLLEPEIKHGGWSQDEN